MCRAYEDGLDRREAIDLSEFVTRSKENGYRPYWPVVTTTEPHPGFSQISTG